MYSQCVSEKSAAQQRRLEAALLELMKDRLFEEISISELCRYTGLSRKTFYRLYEAKADVIYAMIDHALLDAAAYIPDDTVGPGGVHKFLGYWKHRKDLLDALNSNGMSGLLLERMAEIVWNEDYDIRYWLKSRGWKEETDVLVFCLTGFMGLVYRWYYSGFRESPEQMAATMRRLLTTALADDLT